MKIEILHWQQARKSACEIRRTVFINEQHVPEELEWDSSEIESECRHALAWDSQNQAVGYARLLPNSQIGRMAVLSNYRRQGIGHALLSALETEAQKLGMTHIFLHAQTHVRDFYVNFGYEETGDEFDEVDIPHIKMIKTL